MAAASSSWYARRPVAICGDADRRMVDAEKQLVAVSSPNPSTLAGREIEKFQRMAVGIAELEGSHETVCWRQRHRPGIGDRREADPLEFGVGLPVRQGPRDGATAGAAEPVGRMGHRERSIACETSATTSGGK